MITPSDTAAATALSGRSANTPAVPRLRGATGVAQLADILRNRIREGVWPPGHCFTWKEINTEFNLSAERLDWVVLSAMIILKKEGLIESRPYFGSRVTLEGATWNPESDIPGITHAQHIETVMRERIASGVYSVGAQIPTIDKLRAEFGVSSGTVVRGLCPLREQGFIEVRGRLGQFVTPLVESAASEELLTLSAKTFQRHDQVNAFGTAKSLADWSRDERCVVDLGVLKNRHILYKWPLEDALTTPSGVKRKALQGAKGRTPRQMDDREQSRPGEAR